MSDIPEDIMREARELFDGYAEDAVMAAVRPLIDTHVTSLCDIYNRFEPKGQ